MIAFYVLVAIATAALIAVLVAVLVLLKRIDDQFSTNTGHTLRDATNRLEVIADEQARQLDHLAALVTAVGDTGLRIEEAADTDRSAVRGVASALTKAQSAVDQIADDVVSRTKRADETVGTPGEAADAYGRSEPEDT